jgi:helicase
MRDVLRNWVGDANTLYHIEQFGLPYTPQNVSYLKKRGDDYYISLIGELFDRLHNPYEQSLDWSRLGNAIIQAAQVGYGIGAGGSSIDITEASFFAAASFYFGGYSASAYLVLKDVDLRGMTDTQRSCYELISRPFSIRSESVLSLVHAIRIGDLGLIHNQVIQANENSRNAMEIGPDEWILARLYQELATKFMRVNIRSVLPEGTDNFWNPLVASFLNRDPPVWDFFPSQIEAIKSGLIDDRRSFSIQMPTGAGKTALSETLLFYHLTRNPTDVAIFLVPYRSLASELRNSIVPRLNRMGLPTRCIYGGTVPTKDEITDFSEMRVIVATPEALSGFLSIEADFLSHVSLVICDEGHLLDGKARGVGLELLLARMKARGEGSPKFVFISAIVPNIEEINEWLGGGRDTVIRSSFQPAIAEFAKLQVSGKNTDTVVDLVLSPHHEPSAFTLERFLSVDDFRYRNPSTGRLKTFSFSSIKTQAIATARKALPMGAVAVFAANKRGNQGSVGLAQELIRQLDEPLPLGSPIQFVEDIQALQAVIEYLSLEYGVDWIGTKALSIGAVLHHGDIPQETREVVEALVRRGNVKFVICTNTLAEGVNLPIRTLVLYSVQRRMPNGASDNLLARDIKNLVGRAGRAGVSTKGLVVCANQDQWYQVRPVAMQQPGERVSGSLLDLMVALRRAIRSGFTLNNESLENEVDLHTLVDGIDATLVDLMVEEIGEEELVRIATEISEQTFAVRQADQEIVALVNEVFVLRARRIANIANQGRLRWIKETGTRPRMLKSVESDLLTKRERWDDVTSPVDTGLVKNLLSWAWDLPDMKAAVRAFWEQEIDSNEFLPILQGWLSGSSQAEIARTNEIDIDTMLGIHSRIISYVLQVAVEQGLGLLSKSLKVRIRMYLLQ